MSMVAIINRSILEMGDDETKYEDVGYKFAQILERKIQDHWSDRGWVARVNISSAEPPDEVYLDGQDVIEFTEALEILEREALTEACD